MNSWRTRPAGTAGSGSAGRPFGSARPAVGGLCCVSLSRGRLSLSRSGCLGGSVSVGRSVDRLLVHAAGGNSGRPSIILGRRDGRASASRHTRRETRHPAIARPGHGAATAGAARRPMLLAGARGQGRQDSRRRGGQHEQQQSRRAGSAAARTERDGSGRGLSGRWGSPGNKYMAQKARPGEPGAARQTGVAKQDQKERGEVLHRTRDSTCSFEVRETPGGRAVAGRQNTASRRWPIAGRGSAAGQLQALFFVLARWLWPLAFFCLFPRRVSLTPPNSNIAASSHCSQQTKQACGFVFGGKKEKVYRVPTEYCVLAGWLWGCVCVP